MDSGAGGHDQDNHASKAKKTQGIKSNRGSTRGAKAKFHQRQNRNCLSDKFVRTIPSGLQDESSHKSSLPNSFDDRHSNNKAMEGTTIVSSSRNSEIVSLGDSMKDLNLRDTLINQLRSGSYTCLICLSNVKAKDPIWSCDGCYHVYHLCCIIDWALSGTQKSNNRSQMTQAMRSSWRCPSCQKMHTPKTGSLVYRCFCGKTTRPEYHIGSSTIPHGCDEVCGKSKASTSKRNNSLSDRAIACPHTCNELCHPGPCPPCVALMQLHCPCGRVVKTSRCGEDPPEPCGSPCNRLLADGLCAIGTHHCPLPCHDGDCPPCKKLIKSVCYCGRVDAVVLCGSTRAKCFDLSEARSRAVIGELDFCDVEMFFDGDDNEKENLLATKGALEALFVGTVFSCQQTCDRPLDCGHHICNSQCHPGECASCSLLPSQCLTCPCGRVLLSQLVMNRDAMGNRKDCTDPVPVCPNICGRPNPICGHPCPLKCHAGPDCPPCKLITHITCRCGKSSKEIPCLEYVQAMKTDPDSIKFMCSRICRKKKSCGKHKCNRKCCDLVIHACQELCGRTLACGKHTCEDRCHCGPCGTCWRGVINEEVFCHCGATFLPPPQPCGTAPPDCQQPCSRLHPCDHPVQHTCHSEPECPVCTVLMTKRCPGDHTWMFNVPCFQAVVTCGRVCDKPLPGCSHRCRRQCHIGDCLSSSDGTSAVCKQPCTVPRFDCGHACGQPCHETAGISCAEALGSLKCQVLVSLTCECEHLREEEPCFRVKVLVSRLAKKNPNFFLSCSSSSTGLAFGLPSNKVLPCDSSCTQAVEDAKAKEKATTEKEGSGAPKMWVRGGADVVDESLPPAFPPPEYSDWLKQFASNNLSFATEVEKALFDLVDEAIEWMKSSGSHANLNKCLSHRFNPMNHTKRRFIIELAEFYGIECVELDPPPHRFVEALAIIWRVRFPGGGTKQHYVSLTGQINASFVGSFHLNAPTATGVSVPAPIHVTKPALLRCLTDDDAKDTDASSKGIVSFSSVVAASTDNSGN